MILFRSKKSFYICLILRFMNRISFRDFYSRIGGLHVEISNFLLCIQHLFI